MIAILALSIGIVAGLRAMTAPAMISWAAHGGWLALGGGWLAFLGWAYTPWIFTLLALGELVSDQLPGTPSRKVPVQFTTRLIMGALSGAAIGAGGGMLLAGLAAGVVGTMIGTYGGAATRGAMTRTFGADRPAALIEDAVAIGGAALIAVSL